MQILSKGYKKPQTGDFGNTWFPALEDNIDLVNAHTHNGVTGEKIQVIDLTSSTSSISSTDFVDQGDGVYRATFTIPSGGVVDNFVLTFKDPVTKETVYLKTTKFSSTQVYVYTNTVQNFDVFIGV